MRLPAPTVALGALWLGQRRSEKERESTLGLAAAQHAHERALRRGERYFDHRSEVYDALIRFLFVATYFISTTEPLFEIPSAMPAPRQPTFEELTTMQVRLKMYGSPEVESAFEHFLRKQSGFGIAVETLRSIRDQRAESGTAEARADVDKYRDEATKAALEVQMRTHATRRREPARRLALLLGRLRRSRHDVPGVLRAGVRGGGSGRGGE